MKDLIHKGDKFIVDGYPDKLFVATWIPTSHIINRNGDVDTLITTECGNMFYESQCKKQNERTI